VAYLWVDKADPSIPPELLQSYQQVFPLVYANNSVSILENRGGLFPGFLAHDYVAFSKDSYPQAGSILQLSKLNFLGVEIPNSDSNETGLAGISKGGDEVELTPAYRDRPGRSFQILTLQNPRAVNFGAMRFSLPEAQDGGWVDDAQGLSHRVGTSQFADGVQVALDVGADVLDSLGDAGADRDVEGSKGGSDVVHDDSFI
jgi:hypothetical protein